MPVADLLIPDLQWLAPESDEYLPYRVQYRQESWLVCVLEHFCETYNRFWLIISGAPFRKFQRVNTINRCSWSPGFPPGPAAPPHSGSGTPPHSGRLTSRVCPPLSTARPGISSWGLAPSLRLWVSYVHARSPHLIVRHRYDNGCPIQRSDLIPARESCAPPLDANRRYGRPYCGAQPIHGVMGLCFSG